MMFRSTIYSTRRWYEYRRDNGPRKQKRFRWLYNYCAALFRRKRYVRRWSRLRIYNSRNFRNLLDIRKREPLKGLANRLDVVALLLNLAPSVR
jgi:hypothetical protein